MLRIDTEALVGVTKRFHCANCSRNVLPKDPNVAHILLYEHGKKNCIKISIQDAITKIFNIDLDPSVLQSDFTLCSICGNYFAELYKCYERFARLGVFHSKIASLLRRLKNFKKPQSTPQVHTLRNENNQPVGIVIDLGGAEGVNVTSSTEEDAQVVVLENQMDFNNSSFFNNVIAEYVEVEATDTTEQNESFETIQNDDLNSSSEVDAENLVSVTPSSSGSVQSGSTAVFSTGVEHNPEGYKCLLCDYRIPDCLEMAQHLNEIHQFEVDVAKQHCVRAVVLEAQECKIKMNESLIKTFSCLLCERRFKYEHNLKKHLESHAAPNKAVVPVQRVQPKSSQPVCALPLQVNTTLTGYNCLICEHESSVSLKRYEMVTHLVKIHRMDEVEAGNQCVEAMRNKRIKRRFETTKCDYCERLFSKDGMVRHLRTHTASLSPNTIKTEPTLSPNTIKTAPTSELLVQKRDTISIVQNENFCKCSTCGKIISNKKFEDHQSKCKETRRFKCDLCERAFFSSTALQNHKTDHLKHSAKCLKCGETFTTKNSMQTHLISVHEINDAEAVYQAKANIVYEKDVRTSSVKPGKYFPLKQRLRPKIWPCTLCNKLFSTKKDLQSHVESLHLKLKLYNCEICKKKFTQHNTLDAHMRIHYGVKALCSICGKSFSSEVSSQKSQPKEIKSMQPDSAKRKDVRTCPNSRIPQTVVRNLTCTLCSKAFSSRRYLEKHLNCVHLKLRLYGCDICGKRYTDKHFLSAHLTTHDESKLEAAICSICGKTYSCEAYLKVHFKRHLPNTNQIRRKYVHKCSLCRMTFQQESQLLAHTLAHERRPSFPCDLCTIVCSTKRTLYEHKRYHEKRLVKPYKCPIPKCHKRFAGKHMLNYHLKAIHTISSEQARVTAGIGDRRRKANIIPESILS